jgi:hypothetical protein
MRWMTLNWQFDVNSRSSSHFSVCSGPSSHRLALPAEGHVFSGLCSTAISCLLVDQRPTLSIDSIAAAAMTVFLDIPYELREIIYIHALCNHAVRFAPGLIPRHHGRQASRSSLTILHAADACTGSLSRPHLRSTEARAMSASWTCIYTHTRARWGPSTAQLQSISRRQHKKTPKPLHNFERTQRTR